MFCSKCPPVTESHQTLQPCRRTIIDYRTESVRMLPCYYGSHWWTTKPRQWVIKRPSPALASVHSAVLTLVLSQNLASIALVSLCIAKHRHMAHILSSKTQLRPCLKNSKTARHQQSEPKSAGVAMLPARFFCTLFIVSCKYVTILLDEGTADHLIDC